MNDINWGDHKLVWTSYEINVPTANEKTVNDHFIFGVNCGRFLICWSRHEDIRLIQFAYDKLKENFEREHSDLTTAVQEQGPVYLLAMPEMNSGFLASKRFKYLGIMSCSKEGVIDWVWLHPFIRGKGIFSRFLLEYALNERFLNVQPPISKPMQMVVKKVTDIILNDPEKKEKYAYQAKNQLMSYGISPENYKHFSTDEIFRVMSAICNMQVMFTTKFPEKAFATKELARLAIETFNFIQKNPDVKEELTNFALSKQDELEKELKNSFEHVNKYGLNRTYASA